MSFSAIKAPRQCPIRLNPSWSLFPYIHWYWFGPDAQTSRYKAQDITFFNMEPEDTGQYVDTFLQRPVMKFGGTDEYATVPIRPLSGLHGLTVMSWMNLHAFTTYGMCWELSANYNSNNGAWLTDWDATDFYAGYKTTTTYNQIKYPRSGGIATADTWEHFAQVIDPYAKYQAGTACCYLYNDGYEQSGGTRTHSGTFTDYSSTQLDLYVGSRGGTTFFSTQDMADFLILSHTISPDQAKQFANPDNSALALDGVPLILPPKRQLWKWNLLPSVSDLLTLKTSSASTVEVHAVWEDNTTSSLVAGRANNIISNATTTTIIDPPAASTQRKIRNVSIKNTGSSINTITVEHSNGTLTPELYKRTLTAGEQVIFDGSQWININNGGIPATISKPTYYDIQSFTSYGSFVWTKPTAFKPTFVKVILYGAGGGGGSGGSLETATVAKGGSGGGGGAMVSKTFLADDLASKEIVVVGMGGQSASPGGAGVQGVSGSQGGATVFGSLSTSIFAHTGKLFAGGGGGGGGGTNSASTGGGGGGGGTAGCGVSAGVGSSGGAGGLPTPTTSVTGVNGGCGSRGVSTIITTHNGEYGGGGGGGSTSTPATVVGGSSLYGGGGGGNGGCHDATPAIVAGSAGGTSFSYTAGGGGAVGTDGASPTAGTAGTNGNMYKGGSGGGGGGTTVTASTNGGNGGAGGTHGGGGGGGGVGNNPGLGGHGASGGIGAAYILSW